MRHCLHPVSLIAAPTDQDEAAAIALIMREVMETPDKTASLITPDRSLARRVAAELTRWGLTLEASAGEPLRSTPAGIFFDLLADAAATGAQLAILALLKHPLTRLGLPPGAAQQAACVIEIAAMRQPWCGDGVAALAKSLDQTRKSGPRHAAIDRLGEDEWEAAHETVRRLRDALAPFAELANARRVPLQELARAHAESGGCAHCRTTMAKAPALPIRPTPPRSRYSWHPLAEQPSCPDICRWPTTLPCSAA